MSIRQIGIILFVLIVSSMSLTLVSSCGLITSLGEMTPAKLIAQPDGNSHTLTCKLNPNSIDSYNASSKDIFFVFQPTNEKNSIDFERSHVQLLDQYTAQLKYTINSTNQKGLIYCKLKHASESHVVCLTDVRVIDTKVNDFNCIYEYKQKLRCSWTREDMTNYKLIYRPKPIKVFDANCTPDTSENPVTCEYKFNEIRIFEGFVNEFNFILLWNNTFGEKHQNFSINITSIVKLNAPNDLQFDAQTDKLIWNYDNVESAILNELIYMINITEVDNTVVGQKSVQIKTDGQTYTNLTDYLKPYTNYTVSIQSKVINSYPENPYWSEATSIIITSKEAAPASSPVVISQAFHVDQTKIVPIVCTVRIYWKPLEAHLRNSFTVGYNISYRIVGEHNTWQHVLTNQSKFIFTNLNTSAYEFRIYSYNGAGKSHNYSTIVLPTLEKLRSISNDANSIKTQKVYKEYDTDHYYNYTIEWEHGERDHNYTVFWCEKMDPLRDCSGPLNWKFTNHNKMILPKLKSGEYLFGLAENFENVSSGINWTPCIADKDNKNTYTLHPLRVTEKSANSIRLKWDFDCHAERNLVNLLNIEYCDEGNFCTNVPVDLTNNAENSYLVTHLQPHTKYKFTVSSPKTSKEVLNVTTEMTKPSMPEHASAIQKDNVILVRWNFNSSMVENFVVRFEGERHYINLTSCQGNTCLYNLTYSTNLTLDAFKDYDIYVSSCNAKHCSNERTARFKTPISNPGKMDIPIVEKIGTSRFRIKLSRKFTFANGPIDGFYVRWKHNQKIVTTRFDANQSYADLEVDCGGILQAKQFKVSVMAVNRLNKTTELNGTDFSDEHSIELCTTNVTVYVFIILSILILVFIILALLYFVNYMNNFRLKKHEFIIKAKCNESDHIEYRMERDHLMPAEEPDLTDALVRQPVRMANGVLTAGGDKLDTSSSEQSHSSEIDTEKPVLSSSSDACYTSDSTMKYENREYFYNNTDESAKPLMASSNLLANDKHGGSSMMPATFHNGGNLSSSSSAASGQYVQRSPINNGNILPLTTLTSVPFRPQTSGNYVSHADAYASQNHSTHV